MGRTKYIHMQGNAGVCEVEGSCTYVRTYIHSDILGRAKVTVCVCTDRALLGGV